MKIGRDKYDGVERKRDETTTRPLRQKKGRLGYGRKDVWKHTLNCSDIYVYAMHTAQYKEAMFSLPYTRENKATSRTRRQPQQKKKPKA